jgi:hypothetical protein
MSPLHALEPAPLVRNCIGLQKVSDHYPNALLTVLTDGAKVTFCLPVRVADMLEAMVMPIHVKINIVGL